jgi:formylglycine-generating enzyme required for sulfatase activity
VSRPHPARDPGTANQYAIYDTNYTGSPSGIAPVGTPALGAGLWGQLDLAGELTEWGLDWYAKYVTPCTDCALLTGSYSKRVLRGGFYLAGNANIEPPDRDEFTPKSRFPQFGFRCARTP